MSEPAAPFSLFSSFAGVARQPERALTVAGSRLSLDAGQSHRIAVSAGTRLVAIAGRLALVEPAIWLDGTCGVGLPVNQIVLAEGEWHEIGCTGVVTVAATKAGELLVVPPQPRWTALWKSWLFR